MLNAMSSALFTGFKKEFHKENGHFTGITSDTDGRIRARNSLEEIEIKHGDKGTLEPGKYILLRYLDPPWQGFYDIFKLAQHVGQRRGCGPPPSQSIRPAAWRGAALGGRGDRGLWACPMMLRTVR